MKLPPALGNPTFQKVIESTYHCIAPTYVLDDGYFFQDWNITFENLIAQHLGIKKQSHAADFVAKWDNGKDALERSVKVFGVTETPTVDEEKVLITHPDFGVIEYRKLAAQIHNGDEMAWMVSLNICDCKDRDRLFSTMMGWIESAL